MRRSYTNKHYRCRAVALLSVSKAALEAGTLALLAERLGGPAAYPDPRRISAPVELRRQLFNPEVTLFAYEYCDLPPVKTELAPGVTLESAIVDLSFYLRHFSGPEDRKHLKRGIGKCLPMLRSGWECLAWQMHFNCPKIEPQGTPCRP